MDVAAAQLEFTDGVCSPDSQAPHRSRRAWWTRSLAQILCRPLSGLLQLRTTRGPQCRGLISANLGEDCFDLPAFAVEGGRLSAG